MMSSDCFLRRSSVIVGAVRNGGVRDEYPDEIKMWKNRYTRKFRAVNINSCDDHYEFVTL